jgi:hypothetical protein
MPLSLLQRKLLSDPALQKPVELTSTKFAVGGSASKGV